MRAVAVRKFGARRLGAEEAHDVSAADAGRALREAYPDGVDAVLDIVNGPAEIKRDAELLKRGGRLVSTVFGGTLNPRQSPQGLAEIARLLAVGALRGKAVIRMR
jgi:D-arabinose 1-dehydrogenase-like Zn-dependent alcohol dehydrogenase